MQHPVRRFLFLLASTRQLGNSEQLAYCAAHHLPTGAAQQWIRLLDYPLPDFVDLRHNGTFPTPTGNAQLLLKATLQATDIVLVAPLYWYSLPVQAKNYLDYWSAWLRIPSLSFRQKMTGKALWSITVGSGDQSEAQPLEASLMLTAQYMQMPWAGMLYGRGSRPNDIQDDVRALEQAKSFFATPMLTPESIRLSNLQKAPLH